MKIGAQVKRAREQALLTQQELSDRAGIGLTTERDGELVMIAVTRGTGTKLVGKQRREAYFPLPNRFVRKHEATFDEHLSQVAKAQFVAQLPQDDLQNHGAGKGRIVEGRSAPFIKGTTAL